MKKIISVACLITVSVIVMFAFMGMSQVKTIEVQPSTGLANKVVVYYFHGTYRCFTCINMEKYAREAIEANFKDVFESGKLEFSSVNVEEHSNEHFEKDYQLYTKSLILSLVKDGKEVKSKNLEKIWEYAQNKQKFIDYVTSELNAFLKGA